MQLDVISEANQEIMESAIIKAEQFTDVINLTAIRV